MILDCFDVSTGVSSIAIYSVWLSADWLAGVVLSNMSSRETRPVQLHSNSIVGVASASVSMARRRVIRYQTLTHTHTLSHTQVIIQTTATHVGTSRACSLLRRNVLQRFKFCLSVCVYLSATDSPQVLISYKQITCGFLWLFYIKLFFPQLSNMNKKWLAFN